MLKKIMSGLKGKNAKVILANFVSLFILQGSTYILPLILLPYLVRVLGIENFGLLAFATATVSLFRAVVAYGFELSGTHQISLQRNNINELSKIFNSIIAVKFLLFLASFIIFSTMIVFIDKFNIHWEVFLFTFFILLGDVLFPIWFFQGIEKMKMITYIRVSYKTLFILTVIFFIHQKDEYIYVPLLDSVGAILAGIYALYYVKKQYSIIFFLPKISDILFQLKNGWHIFISKIAVILYTSLNTFVLGMMTNNIMVGYYSIAEKIYMAIRSLFGPIIQALFPYLVKKYKEDKINYYKLVKKVSIVYFLSLFIFSILTYTFSAELVHLISGKEVKESIEVLKILSIGLIFAIGGFYSVLLVVKLQGKILSKITLIAMFFNVILVFPAIYFYGINGLAFQFVLIQFIQAILQIKYNYEIWR
jgi:PST family polysaccharide transporter